MITMVTLHRASRDGALKDVLNLISSGVNMDAIDVNDKTALHYSSENNHVDIVKALIAAGADVNAKDKHGLAPLFHSSHKNHLDIVKALIAGGADVNAKDKHGWTALHISSVNNRVNIAKALIAAGAFVNARTEKVLIAAGADVNIMDKDGNTVFDGWNFGDKEKACKTMIKYTLLYNPIANRPEFDLERLDEFWSSCEEQVKKLQKTYLGNSCVTFVEFLTEADENKLANYSSEVSFGIDSSLKRASYSEHFPVYSEDVESQFMKGSQRAHYLQESQKLLKECVFKSLTVDIIIKITERLKNEELENLISSK